MAIEARDSTFLNYLITDKRVPVYDVNLENAVVTSTLDIVQCLLSHTPGNSRIQNDILLRLAAHSGKADLVSYFVTLGGDVHACHDQALRYACKRGFLETVKVLLVAGADPNVCNGECMIRACRGGASLSIVVHFSSKRYEGLLGYEEIVRVLLDAGADPNPGLFAAIRGRLSDSVLLLHAKGARLT